jgi:hypothetical protein
MENIINQIQNGSLPKSAIIENLKLQVYTKYASEVILNGCNAKEAANRVSESMVNRPLTNGVINGVRNDIGLTSPFRRVNPKLKKPKSNKNKEFVERFNKTAEEINQRKVRKTNKELAESLLM